MDRPIGDDFRFTEFQPGLPEAIAILRVVENDRRDCKECFFYHSCMSSRERIKDVAGECSASRRKDNKPVFFLKVAWKN